MKKLRGLLLLLAALIALTGGVFAADVSSRTRLLIEESGVVPVEEEREEPLILQGAAGEKPGIDTFTGLYYDQLGEDAQNLYRAVENQVRALLNGEAALTERNGSLSVLIAADEMKDVTRDNYQDTYRQAFSAFLIDHPRERVVIDNLLSYRWENLGRFGGVYSPDGSHVDRIVIEAHILDERYIGRVERLDAAVEAFADAFADAGMTLSRALDQYRFIHDYLCESCAYNYDAVNSSSDSEWYRMAHRAYGALVELEYGTDSGRGAAVCEGYAEAFLLLCRRVGLPCAAVVGDGSLDGGALSVSHAWNVILLDGAWYAVDVTWDDRSSPSDFISSGVVFARLQYDWDYRYFADNRWFLPHEGESPQDHAAMHQNTYSVSSADYELNPPALAPERVEEVSGWSVTGFDILAEDGAYLSSLDWMLQTVTERLPQAASACIHLSGELVGNRTFTVPGGLELRFSGDAEAIRRAPDFRGTMLRVSVGGTLELDGVRLDGGQIETAAPMLALEDGTADAYARAVFRGCVLTGSRGAAAVDAGDCARVLLYDGAVLSDNLADGRAAGFRLADSALLTLNGERIENAAAMEQSVCVSRLWTDEGVRASVLCQEDAVLVCAAYDESGRLRGAAARTAGAGCGTYAFSMPEEPAFDMRLFALRADTLAPLMK